MSPVFLCCAFHTLPPICHISLTSHPTWYHCVLLHLCVCSTQYPIIKRPVRKHGVPWPLKPETAPHFPDTTKAKTESTNKTDDVSPGFIFVYPHFLARLPHSQRSQNSILRTKIYPENSAIVFRLATSLRCESMFSPISYPFSDKLGILTKDSDIA